MINFLINKIHKGLIQTFQWYVTNCSDFQNQFLTYSMIYHSAGKLLQQHAPGTELSSNRGIVRVERKNACECSSRAVKGSVRPSDGHDSSSPISSRMFCCDSSQRPYSSRRPIFQNSDYISPFQRFFCEIPFYSLQQGR